jgi:hypothetical protein
MVWIGLDVSIGFTVDVWGSWETHPTAPKETSNNNKKSNFFSIDIMKRFIFVGVVSFLEAANPEHHNTDPDENKTSNN